MYTPPYSRWIRCIVRIWIAVLVILAVVYGILLSPISPLHRCTLMGCRDTLELSLSHEPSSAYTVELTSSTGETRQITCTPGQISARSDTSARCRNGIVTFYGLSPAGVEIVITWQAGSYQVNGSPTYATFRPNGLFCPPSCRLGKLSVSLP